MRAATPKRAAQLRVYAKLRGLFLAVHTRCEFPEGCGRLAAEVHHRRGRRGVLLLAAEHWSALCREHHQWVTEHPAQAYAMGISERRIGAA